MSEQQPINTSGESNPVTDSCVSINVAALELDLFFDGTWNSKENSDRYNVEAPHIHGEHSAERTNERYNPSAFFGKVDSYSFARAPTGVDRMHRAMTTDQPHLFGLYVDGSGITTRTQKHTRGASADQPQWEYHADNPNGAGVGMGSTGVYAKLKMMLKQIQAKLDSYKGCQKKPVILTFNVFGFSRGAATARIFCNWLFSQPDKDFVTEHLEVAGYAVQFKFVGLFDTVSSIGTDHTDDVEEETLWLAFTQQDISRIVHITAEHEFRQKFNLVNIAQSVQAGVGLEFSLPGCHTDIGDGLSTLGKINKFTDEWYVRGWDDEKQHILSKDRRAVYDLERRRVSHFEDTPADSAKNVEHLSWFRRLVSPSVLEYQHIAKQGQNHADVPALMAHLLAEGWAVNPPDSVAYQCQGISCTPETCSVKAQQMAGQAAGSTGSPELFIRCQGNKQHLVLDRKQLSPDYPKIPTYIMMALMKRYHAYHLEEAALKQYPLTDSATAPELMALYQALEAQALTLDDERSRGYIGEYRAESEVNPNRLNVQEEALRKTMYHRYLHFSSNNSGLIPVSIANFDNQTNRYYRNVVSG